MQAPHPRAHGGPEAVVVERLGDAGNPRALSLIAIAEHGIPDDSASRQAKLAADCRAFPLFIHDPRKGEKMSERLSLQGNVAMDVTRILAKSVDELRETDIAQHALDALAGEQRHEHLAAIHVHGTCLRRPCRARPPPGETASARRRR